MADKQKTIAKETTLKGKGLHTGLEVEMIIKPAPVNHGYKFKRIDLKDKPVIEAIADNVIDTSRGTTIGKDANNISTIEHTLSALAGLGIDNAMIEINAPEAPIIDGSSKFFVKAIKESGIKEQEANRKYFKVKDKISYYNEEKGIEIIAYPDDSLSFYVLIDYPSNVLKNQFAELSDMANFEKEIASSRTFSFFHELEYLLDNNLIKGGDIENAIVIIDKDVKQKDIDKMANLFQKPKIDVKPGQILCNPELHFPNEPARHKILDLIGDLSLAGMPIQGKIFAKRPGHMANTEFAKIIRKEIKKDQQTTTPPVYDPNKKPFMDVHQIKELLPHRHPFLFVDKIIEMDNESIVGLKNITLDEHFFQGHFPNEPLFPGVLQIEAMAQVGGILVLSTVPDPENYLTFFMKVEHAKFRKQVVPGDTILFKLKLASPIRRGICHMIGHAFVGKNIVMEAEMMAQIVKVK